MTNKDLFEVLEPAYPSRRGAYKLVRFNTMQDDSTLVWKPQPLGNSKRDINIMSEILYAKENRLAQHPYWFDEPLEFIQEYTKFYNELFSLNWICSKEARHNIVVNPTCCLTLVQYNNGTLHAYSRSTDMRNGYHSDKQVLNFLAQTINALKPEYHVDKIVWYLAIPHVYTTKGIARLIDKGEQHE